MREQTSSRAARTQTELPDFIGAPRAAGLDPGPVRPEVFLSLDFMCTPLRDPVTSHSSFHRRRTLTAALPSPPLGRQGVLWAPLTGCVSPRSVKTPHARSCTRIIIPVAE